MLYIQLIIYFIHSSLHLLILYPILSSPSLFPLLRLLCSLYLYEQCLVVKLIFNNENSKQREAQHVMASCGHSTKYTFVCILSHSVVSKSLQPHEL